MATEKEKMLAGELYFAADPQLVEERLRCRRLIRAFNDHDPADEAGRVGALKMLFERFGEKSQIEPPFHCDYGSNISMGARCFVNFQCVILDCARVEIGDDVFMAPGVHIYTATHPVDPEERVSGFEFARPVRIGSKVWLGGGAIILPGVTIGEGSTIGAGSVVRQDIPARVVAAGNPCRVVRTL